MPDPARHPERDEKIVALLADPNARLEDVAQVFGLTRERVRQIYEARTGGARPSRGHATRPATRDALAVLRRDPSIESVTAAVRAAGHNVDNATSTHCDLRRLDLMVPVTRLFRMRRKRRLRAAVVASLRRVHAERGRVAVAMYSGPKVYGASVDMIYEAFGSFPAACRAAGVPVNVRNAGPGSSKQRWITIPPNET